MKDKLGSVMGWRIHKLLWRMTLKNYGMKLSRAMRTVIEWHIKSRFGFGLWRRARYMRLVPRIVDNKPVWVLCHDEKRFIGWRKVELATATTPEELLPLADHRMQPAKFLRKKGDAYTVEEESAGEQVMTYMVKLMASFAGDAKTGGKWEIADADELRPQGTDNGTTPAGGAIEEHAESTKETRDGEAQGGATPKDALSSTGEDRRPEEATSEVPAERT